MTAAACAYAPRRPVTGAAQGIHRPQRALEGHVIDSSTQTIRTSANITALTRHQTHLEQALKGPDVIAPYVGHRLEEKLAEITAFLTSHGQPQLGHA